MSDPEKTEYFASQLKIAIQESNLSTKQLAAKADISEGTIDQWKHGTTLPRIRSLIKLAKALDKSVSWLVG